MPTILSTRLENLLSAEVELDNAWGYLLEVMGDDAIKEGVPLEEVLRGFSESVEDFKAGVADAVGTSPLASDDEIVGIVKKAAAGGWQTPVALEALNASLQKIRSALFDAGCLARAVPPEGERADSLVLEAIEKLRDGRDTARKELTSVNDARKELRKRVDVLAQLNNMAAASPGLGTDRGEDALRPVSEELIDAEIVADSATALLDQVANALNVESHDKILSAVVDLGYSADKSIGGVLKMIDVAHALAGGFQDD